MAVSRNMEGAVQLGRAIGLLVLMFGASQARPVDLGQVQDPSNFVCDACLDFSLEVQMILSNPETQMNAADLISEMICESLTPKLKPKCLDLVNTYVLDAFAAVQTYLGPEFCTGRGLCTSESVRNIKPQGKLFDRTERVNVNTCALCEEFAKDALPYLTANTTQLKIMEALHHACAKLEDKSKQCELLVDIYATELIKHLDDMTPEELCYAAHFCRAAPALSVRGVTRNDCAICQFVVLELKLKLRDPVTQERLLEVLLNGCDRVQNHEDECKMIVTQYAPFILANLDSILDADALCSRIGACKMIAVEPKLVLASEGRAHDRVYAL